MKKVAIVMGSASDLPVMKAAVSMLTELQIPTVVRVLSAHRTPAQASEFAQRAREENFGVIIAAAGKAAHLAGSIAAQTTLPVIGVPVKSSTLDGLDALLSTVQMPAGIPVATVAIDGAQNAALLAAEILAVTDETIAAGLQALRSQMRDKVLQSDALIEKELAQNL
jgi:5-(carboxyamino)imidazole ribonucleotide mutase